MDAMDLEERINRQRDLLYINRKKKIYSSYILNLQTTSNDSDDSVTERSSSLLSEVPARYCFADLQTTNNDSDDSVPERSSSLLSEVTARYNFSDLQTTNNDSDDSVPEGSSSLLSEVPARYNFSDLQTTNNDSDDSVPERSSSLLSEVSARSAPSLSPRRIYTPLPELLRKAETQHCDDRESSYQPLIKRTPKYMSKIMYLSKTSDSSTSSGTYEEKSYQQLFKEKKNQDETKKSSNDTSQSTRQSKKRTRNSEGVECPLRFKSKRSKVDVSTQTEFSFDDETSPTSRKSDFTTRQEVRLDLKQEKFSIGVIKIFNICTCRKHECK